MCSRLTVLAHTSPARKIAQCEHGSLHLSWDIATIHLRRPEFLTLAQFLECWALRDEPLAFGDGWCQVVRDGRGALRLWIGQVGLAIASGDVPGFLALIQSSFMVLLSSGGQPGAPPLNIQRCPLLTIDASAFGHN